MKCIFHILTMLRCSYNVVTMLHLLCFSFHLSTDHCTWTIVVEFLCCRTLYLLVEILLVHYLSCFLKTLKNKIFWYSGNYFTWQVKLQLCYLCHCDTYKHEHYRCFLYSIWKGSTCSFKNAKEMWMWNILKLFLNWKQSRSHLFFAFFFFFGITFKTTLCY